MIKNFNIFESINIKPNFSEERGLEYVYVTKDYSYAASYANGNYSTARPGDDRVRNGVIFVVYLDDDTLHYGGDIWKTFEDDVVDDLKNFLQNGEVNGLLEKMFGFTGLDIDDLNKKYIKSMIKDPVKYLLQLISPYDWSIIQQSEMDYSEVALKEIPFSSIIEIKVFRNYKLEKTIKGGCNENIDEEDFQNIFYHGSPLRFWEDKLKNL
jgi:hypothetical protein